MFSNKITESLKDCPFVIKEVVGNRIREIQSMLSELAGASQRQVASTEEKLIDLAEHLRSEFPKSDFFSPEKNPEVQDDETDESEGGETEETSETEEADEAPSLEDEASESANDPAPESEVEVEAAPEPKAEAVEAVEAVPEPEPEPAPEAKTTPTPAPKTKKKK